MYNLSHDQITNRNRILAAIKNHPSFSPGEIKAHVIRTQMSPQDYDLAVHGLLLEGIIAYGDEIFEIVGGYT